MFDVFILREGENFRRENDYDIEIPRLEPHGNEVSNSIVL